MLLEFEGACDFHTIKSISNDELENLLDEVLSISILLSLFQTR